MLLKLYFATLTRFQNVVLIFLITTAATALSKSFDPSTCKLSQETKDEIRSYLPVVEQLRKSIQGPFKHKTYDDLDEFIDVAGPRVSGSKGVDRAINYLTDKLRQPDTGIKIIQKEAVDVPKPTIGTEQAEMILPRKKKLPILPERWGKNTPEEGILAKVVVVTSLEDLRNKQKYEVSGKIVVFNFFEDDRNVTGYKDGIREGAVMGVAAILLRSITPFSLYTLVEFTNLGEPPVPVATLTVEDAELLTRIATRGEQIVIRMFILGYYMRRGISYNVIGDYEGTKFSDQYVVISGHLDNVKVGLGAQDDGIGLLLSLNAIRLLNSVKLRPKYTLRVIFWTAEEYRLAGAFEFVKAHAQKIADGRYRAGLEADGGCEGLPRLFAKGSSEFYCILNEILVSLLKFNSGDSNVNVMVGSTDLGAMKNLSSMPIVNFGEGRDGTYNWVRHSAGDMMTAVDADDLDTCLLVYTTTSFVLSDLDKLPKSNG